MRTPCVAVLTWIAACAGEPAADAPREEAPVCLDEPAACDEEALVYDNDGDGAPDIGITSVWGPHGVIRTTTDTDGDGVADFVEQRSYDDLGRLTRIESDFDFDGTVDSTDIWSWSDAPFQWTLYRDDGGDGMVNVREVHNFDAEDRLTSIETDYGNDGVVEDMTRYEYDARGNRTARRYDGGNDGVDDVIDRTRYDEEDRVVYTGTQFGEIGPASQWTTWAYDTCGRILTRIDVTIRTDRVDRAYDAEGRLETEIVDTYADGIADLVWTYTYDGLNQTADADNGNDGTIDIRITRLFDEDGRIVLERYDDGADGVAESSWSADRVCPS